MGNTAPPGTTGAGLKEAAEILAKAKELMPGFEKETRSGPLQVIGRLMLGLAAIAAVSASVSGYLDWRATNSISESTHWLRWGLIALILLCLAGSVTLISFLAKRHPSLLSSPSEWSEKVHEVLVEPALMADLRTAVFDAVAKQRTEKEAKDRQEKEAEG